MSYFDKDVLDKTVLDAKNKAIGQRMFEDGDLAELDMTLSIDNTVLAKAKYDGRYVADNQVIYDFLTHKVIDYNCSCRWCYKYSPCAHVMATLLNIDDISPNKLPFKYKVNRIEYLDRMRAKALELQKQREIETEKRVNQYKLSESKLFINQLKQITSLERIVIKDDDNQNHIEVEIDYFKSYIYEVPNIKLSLKVGYNKMYIVKNVELFLNEIANNAYVDYGKEFKCILSYDSFDDNSKKVIDFLRLNNTNSLGYNNRNVLIDDFDIFFDTFKDLININYIFSEENDIAKISFSNNNLGYDIKVESEYDLHKKHYYNINPENHVITRIVFDPELKVNKLLADLTHHDFIAYEDLNDFYKYAIKDVLKYLSLDGISFNVTNNIVDLKLYGDITNDDNLIFTLKCFYEDGSYGYGFDLNNNNTSLLMDKVVTFIQEYSTEIDYDTHNVYMSLSNEKTYSFIKEGLVVLQDLIEVYVSEALRNIGVNKAYAITLGVRISNDLLAIDIDSNDIPLDDLENVLKAYKRKKKFVKLKNGQFISLESDDLKELDDILTNYDINLNQMKNNQINMNLYRAMSLDHLTNDTSRIKLNRSLSYNTFVENFKKESIFTIKDHYKEILRDYQVNGIKWLDKLNQYNFNGILADDMGLGKTLQVIAYLDSKANTLPSIVVCPSSLILNWIDEINKFSNDLKAVSIMGAQVQREYTISTINEYDVVITSYDYIKRDIELYKDTKFNYVILDEAQYIKNQKTKSASSVKQLQSSHKLALTGTPIENSLAELWSMFDFLMPDYLFNYHYFKQHFETLIVKDKDNKAQDKLIKMIEPFILRRNKKEVLKELPDKIEQTITIDFNEDERKLYLANLLQISKELQSKIKTANFDKIQVLAGLTRLRQICIEPRLLFENIETISSKMEMALDIIETYKSTNKKLLMFSSFTGVFDYLTGELRQRDIKYLKLTGQTNKEERRELVNRFQEDDTTLFLISLKAGGTGLNLTAAEGVIHFDPWWNLSAQNQATDRTYRIGQQNNVQVYKLIMKDSIEEKIVNLQHIKKDLADTFVEGNQGSIAALSVDEIMDLFKI